MCTSLGRLSTPRITTLFRLPPVVSYFHSKIEVDAIDEFTSQLMQRKIGKWEQRKRQNDSLIENNPVKSSLKSVNYSLPEDYEPEKSFQYLIDNEETNKVIQLTEACVQKRELPPSSLLIKIFSICSQHGERGLIIKLQKLCKEQYLEFSLENSDFKHFLAEAIWLKGDISRALEIFESVYRENAYLRRRIRLMIRYLASNLVANGSEAALSNMISFSERILRDFQDFLPITCIWQACFLSEWFRDQTVALELLEKHTTLCKSAVNRIPYVVYVSLKCHRTEIVYRLLEILLKNKMKQQYSAVLGALLDYQFRFGDLARCAEIIKWSIEQDVPLPQKSHIKLINKLLSDKMKTPLAAIEKNKEEEYEYKF